MSDCNNFLSSIERGSWQDRAMGMILAHALGDAVGAPYEFQNIEYTGKCDQVITIRSRWQGLKSNVPGQTTDDNQMALILLHTISEGYTAAKAVFNYCDWATNCSMTGKNTSNLFKSIRAKDVNARYRTYLKRFEKFGSVENESNGSLMRSCPLALIEDNETRLQICRIDCSLSNPNVDCVRANLVYVEMLHVLIYGNQQNVDVMSIINYLFSHEPNFHDDILPLMNLFLEQSKNLESVQVSNRQNKGWYRHAFTLALAALNYEGRFMDFMEKLAKKKGDTDTNMCIAGAVLGAKRGLHALCEEPLVVENLGYIFESDWKFSQMTKNMDKSTYFHPRNLFLETIEKCRCMCQV